MYTAEELRVLLDLVPHPREGGFFIETYRAAESIRPSALPARYDGERAHGTAIYYLLSPETFSAMHRLGSDEVFHFYLGDPVEMLQLHPDGTGRRCFLGLDLRAGMRPQIVVPRGVWQGARLAAGGRCALLGTTVAPGFDDRDYEEGARDALQATHPQFRELILALTHQG